MSPESDSVDMADTSGGFRHPTKLMAVGDSMTHGREGDFTWRYRLWQWLHQERVDFQFVGPYKGTNTPGKAHPPHPPPLEGEPGPDDGRPIERDGYAAGVDFESGHFAAWGRQAAQSKDLINAEVERHDPDYLLVMLGFNDMGWGVGGPEETIAAMKELVDNARAAKPRLRFAVANVPQRTPVPGAEHLPSMVNRYNQLLRTSVDEWSRPESPVRLVTVREEYDCFEGGYDGLHPNALGEFQIAKAFSMTLTREFGIGQNELTIPQEIPERPTPVPQNVRAEAVPYGIAVTWDWVYGAFGYDVRSRLGNEVDWNKRRVEVNRFDSTWTQDKTEYQYQVRTYNGDNLQSEWSPIVSAITELMTAPGPSDIIVSPAVGEVSVGWKEPAGQWDIDRFEVTTADVSTELMFPTRIGVKGTNKILRDFIPGHRYAITISTWTQHGGGLPTAGRQFVAGHGKPEIPTQLDVETKDATTVQLRWEGSKAAAGYRVWVRNPGESSEFTEDGQTHRTEHGIAFLFPGTWNFAFCVSAYNGNLESERSSIIVPPRND